METISVKTLAALRSDSDAHVRRNAVQALRRLPISATASCCQVALTGELSRGLLCRVRIAMLGIHDCGVIIGGVLSPGAPFAQTCHFTRCSLSI
jgi:hypothetical protein